MIEVIYKDININELKLLILESVAASSSIYNTKFDILKSKVLELTEIVDTYEIKTVQKELIEIKKENTNFKKIVENYTDEVKILQAIIENNVTVIKNLTTEVQELRLNVGEVQLIDISNKKEAADLALAEMQNIVVDKVINELRKL